MQSPQKEEGESKSPLKKHLERSLPRRNDGKMKSLYHLKKLLCAWLFVLSGVSVFGENANYSGIEFVKIPQGEFTFDNSYYYKFNHSRVKRDSDHVTVRISSFSISRFPVKRLLWEKILGEEKFPPWSEYSEKCPDCPAENLLFKDVMLFLDELSNKDFGKKGLYRLPTESELVYILCQCEKDSCGSLKSYGSQMEIRLKSGYKNKFGVETYFNSSYQDEYTVEVSRQKNKTIYFFTEDYPSNNYLGSVVDGKQVVANPRPAPDKKFDYGRILLSFYKLNDRVQINRLGHSINMLPENSKVFFYIVKK